MRKLSFIFVCLLLAVLIAITGCSFNPAGDSSQETEETQPGTPSDTPEENPDNTPSEDNPSTAPGEDDTPSGGGEEKPPISDTLRDPTDTEKRMLDMHCNAISACQSAWLSENNIPGGSPVTKPEGASLIASYSSSGRVYTLSLDIKNFEYKEGTDTLVITNGNLRTEFTFKESIPAGFTPEDLFTSEEEWFAMDMYVDSHFTFNDSKEYWTTGTIMTSATANEVKDFTLDGQRLNYTFPIVDTPVIPDPVIPEELV